MPIDEIARKYGRETNFADASGFDDVVSEWGAISRDLDRLAERSRKLRANALRLNTPSLNASEQKTVRDIINKSIDVYKRVKGA